MNPRWHAFGGIVLATLAGSMAACSATPGPEPEPLHLRGVTSLPAGPWLGVMMIWDETSDGEVGTFARTILDPSIQPPMEGLNRFARVPWTIREKDQSSAAASSLGSSDPSPGLTVFWEIVEDEQGNGVFLYICIVLGDADWFVFGEETSEETKEPGLSKRVDPDREPFMNVRRVVSRAEILEAVEQTGYKVILSDRRNETVKTVPLGVDLPVLWADLLKEGDRRVICGAFAEGVAVTLARNLDTLPRP